MVALVVKLFLIHFNEMGVMLWMFSHGALHFSTKQETRIENYTQFCLLYIFSPNRCEMQPIGRSVHSIAGHLKVM